MYNRDRIGRMKIFVKHYLLLYFLEYLVKIQRFYEEKKHYCKYSSCLPRILELVRFGVDLSREGFNKHLKLIR